MVLLGGRCRPRATRPGRRSGTYRERYTCDVADHEGSKRLKSGIIGVPAPRSPVKKALRAYGPKQLMRMICDLNGTSTLKVMIRPSRLPRWLAHQTHMEDLH